MSCKLSILIPTLPERKDQLAKLLACIEPSDEVEILIDDTDRSMSIGIKRNNLYNRANGLYSVQIDDDDTVPIDYIQEVLANLGSDCIGYLEHCTINGQVQMSSITMKNKQWSSHSNQYFRTPHFKTPILTSLCQKVGVKDMRFGEDHDFAKRVYPLIKSETFINKIMYYYTANSLTKEQHKQRYGL